MTALFFEDFSNNTSKVKVSVQSSVLIHLKKVFINVQHIFCIYMDICIDVDMF